MQNERWQREVVDDMSFVPFAEIAQVLGLGHIGFGQKDDRFDGVVAQQSDQLHDGVGLRQVDRRRPRLFPQERHRIETDDLNSVVDMRPNDPKEFEQNLWITKIKVDLIVAERAPDMARTVLCVDLLQERRGPGPHNHAQII